MLLFTACGDFQKLLKSNNNQLKYETAVSLFNKGSYNRASQLFEQVTAEFRGTDKAEKIAYMYAYCYYHESDYILANYQFKQFSENFPTSQYAEECAYMAAYCKYLDSPIFSLDQTNTYDAMKELQVFINRYPQSSRVELSNELIDKLREKLELKALRRVNFFIRPMIYRLQSSHSITCLKEYPDTRYREDALFFLIKAYRQFAQKSIETKIPERYAQVFEACDKLLSDFPKSKYAREVNIAKTESEKYIKK